MPKKICVVIQGLLVSKGLNACDYLDEKYNNKTPVMTTFYSKNHCDFYDNLLEFFDDILFSTWEGEKGFGGYNFIYNKRIAPDKVGGNGMLADNKNLQSISSLNGILYFQEKYGNECIVVKIRSDITMDAAVLYNATRRISRDKIYPDYLMGLCSINDFIISGEIRSLKIFFECSLFKNDNLMGNAHFDYVHNYMVYKYGKIKFLQDSTHPYIACQTRDSNTAKGVFNLREKFENTFSSLFTRDEFDLLRLEWRGSPFKNHKLYKYHMDRQIFMHDKVYTKKINCKSRIYLQYSYYKHRIKKKLKQVINA